MSHQSEILHSFITARKQNLGQGNVFTPLCHSVQQGDLSLSMHHRSHEWGSLSRGGAFVQGMSLSGGVCSGGVSVQGESLSRGVSVQGVSVQGNSVHGGSLPRGCLCLRDLCPEESLSKGGLCPGGLCQGDSTPGRDPITILENLLKVCHITLLLH